MSFFTQSSPWTTSSSLAGPFLRRTYSTGGPYFDSYQAVRRAVFGLIGVNAAVFAAWQYADYKKDYKLRHLLMRNATLSYENFKEGRYWTLITSAFSHQNLTHFLFNMVALHAFGTILSFVPGMRAVYVLSLTIGSGIAGSCGWMYHQFFKRSKSGSRSPTISSALGASGMVCGAGAAATCLMPFAPMNMFFIPIAIPLFVVTGLYVGLDAYYLDRGSRIGHAAHLGGSVYGALFYFAYLRKYGGVWNMARRALRR